MFDQYRLKNEHNNTESVFCVTQFVTSSLAVFAAAILV